MLCPCVCPLVAGSAYVSLQHRRGHTAQAELRANELPDPNLCIGDIFLQFARLFKLYGEYASHHEAASQALEELELGVQRYRHD